MSVFARHLLFCLTCSVLPFVGAGQVTGSLSGRPNVLLLLADDLGVGDLGALNQDSRIPTPNVDKLVADSMVFVDAHSSSSVGALSRYGLMTGRYCWRGVSDCRDVMGFDLPLIPEKRETIGDLFANNGYRSAFLGKWGLGLGWMTREGKVGEWESGYVGTGESLNIDFQKPVKGGPTALGFHYFYGLAGSLDSPPYAYIENDITVGIPDQVTRAGGRQGLTVEGFRVVEVMPKLTEKAVQFLEGEAKKEKKDEPFFLVVSMTAPHAPFVPTEKLSGASKAGRYGDSVAMVDWSVGQILDRLESLGLAKNTMVVFSSDNGSAKSNQEMEETYGHRPGGQFRGKKGDAWEGGHRVPFIIRWPGVVQPGTSMEVVGQMDLYATFSEMLGVRLREDEAEDSLSFYPLLKGEPSSRTPRDTIIHFAARGTFAIRSGKWKLILPPEHAPSGDEPSAAGELYNLESDLGEQSNLWQNNPALVEKLRKMLEKFRTLDRTRGA